MSGYAILIAGPDTGPRAVRLDAEKDHLALHGAEGTVEQVPWWRLYRLSDHSSTHHFRRLDKRHWELRVISGGDRALLAHVGRRPLHRFIHPFRRLESLKVLIGLTVLAVTLAQHAPVNWQASLIPEFAQRRLVDAAVAEAAPRRCARPDGEAAIRKLLVRLDPELGPKVDVVAVKDGGFIVTSTPGDKLWLERSSMAEVDAAALPALLGHELSHIRHGDPINALLRENGLLNSWGQILEADGHRKLTLQFSGLEERRADLEAMQMMRRSGMPLQPAADMFEKMRVSAAQNGFYGYDQREFHFGVHARSQRWAVAAQSDPPNPAPVLTKSEEDALYNYCWAGPIRAAPPGTKTAPFRQVAPGTGGPSQASPDKP